MQKRIIPQWRDWLLEYIADNNYELIPKDTLEDFTIVGKDGMEAVNKIQLIIKNKNEEWV